MSMFLRLDDKRSSEDNDKDKTMCCSRCRRSISLVECKNLTLVKSQTFLMIIMLPRYKFEAKKLEAQASVEHPDDVGICPSSGHETDREIRR